MKQTSPKPQNQGMKTRGQLALPHTSPGSTPHRALTQPWASVPLGLGMKLWQNPSTMLEILASIPSTKKTQKKTKPTSFHKCSPKFER
jgi:hypothetical protein